MKFVTSLAFKYIRRQKLRSILTFTSITLAVFIMNIFFVFFGTVQRSLKNFETEYSGSWEADLTELFMPDESITDKYEKISSNAVTGDSFISVNSFILDSEKAYEKYSDSITFTAFNITDSKNNQIVYDSISSRMMSGNPELYTDPEESDRKRIFSSPQTGDIILPYEFQDLGYNENDMITLSVVPVIRTISLNSPMVRKETESGPDPSSPYFNANMRNILISTYGKDNLKYDTEEYGNEVTETFRIIGFDHSYSNSYSKIFGTVSPLCDYDFTSEICEANSSIIQQYKAVNHAVIRIKEDLSFSGSMDQLVKDLGYTEGYYSLLDHESFHTNLLAAELRDYYGLADFIIFIVIFTVIILLCWFLSRFIIDNAFEISAQERNAQFAILRIIGSSKKQITAFTFTEAAFYSATSIPAGTVLSILFSYFAFYSLKDYITCIELYISPILTAAGILLCLLAVFISSFTSALYGSRKKTLSETYYNTYLSDNIKTGKEKKTRSSSASGIFILRYTLKNIFRTRKRFIISSAALITGTLMLTFSGIFSAAYLNETSDLREAMSLRPDFALYTYSDTEKKLAEDHLRNNPLFSLSYSITELQTGYDEQNYKAIQELISGYAETDFPYSTSGIDENAYKLFIEDIAGMSYTKFSSSSQGLFYISGNENKCIELDKPFTFIIDSSRSFEIRKIIVTKNRIPDCWSSVIISEKLLKKFTADRKYEAGYSSLMCRLSSPGKYREAKSYIRGTINPDSYNDRFISSSGETAILFAVIRLVSVLLGMIWLTGVLSMANSVNSSVLNREHELIMMRSVGMSMKQLRNTVITESVVFSSFSTVIGTAAGIALFAAVYSGPASNALPGTAGIIAAVIAVNSAVSVIAALPGIYNLKNKLKV